MIYKNENLMENYEFNEFKNELNHVMAQVLKEIETLKQKPVFSEVWLDNPEACKKLRVCTRTMQNYRDNGLLAFSQIGGKLFYKLSDIQKMLESHYYPKFNRKWD